MYNNDKCFQDRFKLQLGISKADSLRKEKIELLSRIGLLAVNEFLIDSKKRVISGKLLGFLRIFHMNKNQIDHWLKSSKNEVYSIMERSNMFEEIFDKQICDFLIIRLKLLLSTYKKSDQVNT